MFLPGRSRRYIDSEKYFFSNLYKEYDSLSPIEVGGFYCPFVFFKKKLFMISKGFDPDFFMYAEDVDLFRNRFSSKYKSILYPFIGAKHFSGKTDKYNLMSKQSMVSYLLYLNKAGSYFLFSYICLLSLRYLLVLICSFVIKNSKQRDESLCFYGSLLYLKKIIKSKKYSSLSRQLKIKEIPD